MPGVRAAGVAGGGRGHGRRAGLALVGLVGVGRHETEHVAQQGGQPHCGRRLELAVVDAHAQAVEVAAGRRPEGGGQAGAQKPPGQGEHDHAEPRRLQPQAERLQRAVDRAFPPAVDGHGSDTGQPPPARIRANPTGRRQGLPAHRPRMSAEHAARIRDWHERAYVEMRREQTTRHAYLGQAATAYDVTLAEQLQATSDELEAAEAAVARLYRQPVVPAELGRPWWELLTAMTARDPADRPTAAGCVQRLHAMKQLSFKSQPRHRVGRAPHGPLALVEHAVEIDEHAPSRQIAFPRFGAPSIRQARSWRQLPADGTEMTTMVENFRHLYNNVRPHETLNSERPIKRYLPDPDQPPLPEVDEALRPFVGASKKNKRLYEFGGIVRKPAA